MPKKPKPPKSEVYMALKGAIQALKAAQQELDYVAKKSLIVDEHESFSRMLNARTEKGSHKVLNDISVKRITVFLNQMAHLNDGILDNVEDCLRACLDEARLFDRAANRTAHSRWRPPREKPTEA